MYKVLTKTYCVTLRVEQTFDLIGRKYFFKKEKAEEYKKQIEDNVNGVEIFMDEYSMEDTLVYED